MHPTFSIALFSVLPLSLAANIPITVGSGGLVFKPSVVKAEVGDTLTFSYYPKNHSVAQSSFANPCHPLAGGFFSGFQPLSAGPGPVDFVVEINDTKPVWIYCSQAIDSHCQHGMAMVVNEPATPSPNTLAAYKLAAAKTGNSTSPSRVAGGVFVSRNSTSTTGQNPTASSTASSGIALSSGSSNSSGTSSSSGTGSSGSGTGSGSNTGSGSTTGGASQSSPISFQGAASKMVTGLGISAGAVAVFAFSLV